MFNIYYVLARTEYLYTFKHSVSFCIHNFYLSVSIFIFSYLLCFLLLYISVVSHLPPYLYLHTIYPPLSLFLYTFIPSLYLLSFSLSSFIRSSFYFTSILLYLFSLPLVFLYRRASCLFLPSNFCLSLPSSLLLPLPPLSFCTFAPLSLYLHIFSLSLSVYPHTFSPSFPSFTAKKKLLAPWTSNGRQTRGVDDVRACSVALTRSLFLTFLETCKKRGVST